MRRRVLLAAAIAVIALVPFMPDRAAAQVFQISQRGTVSQKFANTLISVDYSRPVMRGRSYQEIFGKLVHWGELWTPGANQATVFEASDTVTVNDVRVNPGRWSMWVIPSQVGRWELVLDARDSLFHTQRPDSGENQVVIPLEVRQDAAPVEVLTWTFPRVAPEGGTLVMNWGPLEIPLELGVKFDPPQAKVAAEEAALYTGAWDVVFERNPETGRTRPPTTLTIRVDEHGLLWASYPPGVFEPPPSPAAADAVDETKLTPQERERAHARRVLAEQASGDFEYVLVPKAQGVFLMGWAEDGMLTEAYPPFHEFELENERPVRVTIRNEEDAVMAKGTRKR
jgi:hypothetical protein